MDAKLERAVGLLKRSNEWGPARQLPAPERSTPGDSLNTRLLADFRSFIPDHESARDASEFAHAALLAAVGDRASQGQTTWENLCCGDDHTSLTVAARTLTDAALRAFASNGPAFDALWSMKVGRGHAIAQNPENKDALRQALQAVDQLRALGSLGPGVPDDWKTVAAQAEIQRTELLNTRLGGSERQDALAWMTLLHANHQLSDAAGDPPACLRAASMAWRNGFTTSGEGTDFNRGVHRMHKFATWVARAVQPQTPSSFIQRTFGRRLSPLLAMQHGLLGGDLGDIKTETSALVQHTHAALQGLSIALEQVIASKAYPDLSDKSKATLHLQQAVIKHWVELGDGLQSDAVLPRNEINRLLALHRNSPAPYAPARVASGILSARFSLGVLEQWANNPDLADHVEMLGVLDRVYDAQRVAAPPSKPQAGDQDHASLLDMAKRALDTEGMQFRHGGIVGFEPVANLGFASPAFSFSGAGGTVRLTRGRSATVRIGTSTIGSDIFLGTDSRFTQGASTFVYAGFSPHESVKLGAAGRIIYRQEQVAETGVSLRVSKTVADHKSQCAKVIDFLFGAAPSTASGPDDAQTHWQRFADEFFDSSVSVNFVATESKSRRITGAVSLGAGVALNQQGVGPSLFAGVERTAASSHRNETAGHATSDVASDRRTTSLIARATLGWSPIPSISPKDGRSQVDAVGVSPLPVAGYQAVFGLPSSSAGQVRVTIENDRILPALSLQQREFRNPNELIAHVQQRRALWEAALGGASGVDEAMQAIRGLGLAPQQSAGNRWFVERLQLTPEAAKTLTLLHAQRVFCLADNSEDAASRQLELDSIFTAALNDSKSWEPEKLAVVEVGNVQDSRGPNFLVVANTVLQTTSVARYLYQAKAAQPAAVLDANRTTGPANESDAEAHPASPSQVHDFRRALNTMYPATGDAYVGSLRRALLRAFPPTGGPDPFARALECAAALRDAVPTALEAIQVLASMKTQLPSASAAVNDARRSVEAKLAGSEAGRAGSPANGTDVALHPEKLAQVEAFRKALNTVYAGPGDAYIGSLRRALLRALPATDGPDAYADPLLVARSLREAASVTPLEAIQVLASIKSRQPGASEAIDRARQSLEAILAASAPGRATLVRLQTQ